MKLMSRRDAEDEFLLETRQHQCLTTMHAHNLTRLMLYEDFINLIDLSFETISLWEITQFILLTSIQAHIQTEVNTLSGLEYKKKKKMNFYLYSTKCIFRQMSRRDVDDEFIWEITQFLLLTSIFVHIQIKVNNNIRTSVF